MKCLFLFYLLFSSPIIFSQCEMSLDVFDHDNPIYNGYFFHAVDTASFADKSYSNGQIKRQFYLNDSLEVDSLKAFHGNGNLALFTSISGFTNIRSRGQLVKAPNYCIRTFYPSGNIRSEEYNHYLDNKQSSVVNIYLDSLLSPITTNIFIYGDTIRGFFPCYTNGYLEYRKYVDKELIEVWKVKGSITERPQVLEYYNVKTGERKTDKVKLGSLMKEHFFAYINNTMVIVKREYL